LSKNTLASKISQRPSGKVSTTLPMFLVLPWLINQGMTFWPALGLCIAGTVVLYFVTMKLLAMAGVQL
jgi:hypothetical protein